MILTVDQSAGQSAGYPRIFPSLIYLINFVLKKNTGPTKLDTRNRVDVFFQVESLILVRIWSRPLRFVALFCAPMPLTSTRQEPTRSWPCYTIQT